MSRLYLFLPFLMAGFFAQAQPLLKGPFIVFIGPPESGKTTQAKLAGDFLKTPVIEVEDMISSNPEAFEKNSRARLSGILPRTDPVLNGIFGKMITEEKYRNGVIIDGYPATKDHADYIRGMIVDGKLPVPTVIQLEISDPDLRKRVGKNAGNDFEQLLKDYHREFDMIGIYFPGAPILKIDATGKPDKVAKRVRQALSQASAAKPSHN